LIGDEKREMPPISARLMASRVKEISGKDRVLEFKSAW